jgi:pseudouridine 5'-phosphatase
MAHHRRKVSGAVFDLDGTLLDAEPLYFRAYAGAAASFGRPTYTFEGVHHALLGRPEQVGVQAFLRLLGLEGTVTPEQVFAARDKVFLAELPDVTPMPGAVEAVRACIASGVPTAIATSSCRSYLTTKRAKNEELFAGLSSIVCGDDECMRGKRGKPAPDIFLEAAAAIGVDPRECVAFEDSVAGVQSAKAAGMFVVMIPDPRLTEAEIDEAGPDLRLRSLVDLDPAALGLVVPAVAAAAAEGAAAAAAVPSGV